MEDKMTTINKWNHRVEKSLLSVFEKQVEVTTIAIRQRAPKVIPGG